MKHIIIDFNGKHIFTSRNNIIVEIKYTIVDDENGTQDNIIKQLIVADTTDVPFNQVEELAFQKIHEYEQFLMESM